MPEPARYGFFIMISPLASQLGLIFFNRGIHGRVHRPGPGKDAKAAADEPEAGFRNAVRLPRDYYVRVFSNDYSVDPSFIGRIVDVAADLDTVWVTHDGVIIATHVRVWARHLVVTDPAHVARAAMMRRDFPTQRVHRPDPEEAVQVPDLAAYDEVFGIDLGDQPALLEVAS